MLHSPATLLVGIYSMAIECMSTKTWYTNVDGITMLTSHILEVIQTSIT